MCSWPSSMAGASLGLCACILGSSTSIRPLKLGGREGRRQEIQPKAFLIVSSHVVVRDLRVLSPIEQLLSSKERMESGLSEGLGRKKRMLVGCLRWPGLSILQSAPRCGAGGECPLSRGPVCWGNNAGSCPGISQLLSLRTELSPFPWQCRRKNSEKNE
jgi:hypothetical protein